MNNLLSFWLAPVTALFHPRVYRDAVKRSGWKGVLYTLYLSAIAGVLTMMLMFVMVMPVANEFVTWTQKNMPVLIWTPEGLSLESGQTTALLVHPQYGPIVAFDMAKKSVNATDMEKVRFFVTADKVYIKRGPKEIEARDITKAGIQTTKQLPPRIRITGEVIGGLFKVVKNIIFMIVPLSIVAFSFLLMLASNLFYSLFGLLLNAILRKQKLRYGTVFALSCFATTVTFTVTWLQIMTPLRRMAVPFGLLLLINFVYLMVAFKITDSDNTEAKA